VFYSTDVRAAQMVCMANKLPLPVICRTRASIHN
jgi:hypothetical protein